MTESQPDSAMASVLSSTEVKREREEGERGGREEGKRRRSIREGEEKREREEGANAGEKDGGIEVEKVRVYSASTGELCGVNVTGDTAQILSETGKQRQNNDGPKTTKGDKVIPCTDVESSVTCVWPFCHPLKCSSKTAAACPELPRCSAHRAGCSERVPVQEVCEAAEN